MADRLECKVQKIITVAFSLVALVVFSTMSLSSTTIYPFLFRAQPFDIIHILKIHNTSVVSMAS